MMARSAVSFYPTDHPALNITVKNRLLQLLREKQEDMAMGLASDFPDYKYRCGVAEGLRTAIAMCDDVMKELSER
jgi:hypothetical protein